MATDSRAPRLGSEPWLGPGNHGQLLSWREFADSSLEPPWKFEREAGRLVVMSPDSKEHDDCSEPIRDHLGAYRLTHFDRVQQVVSGSWIRVNAGTDRIADIAVYLVPVQPVPSRPDRVPEIVIEVVSPDRESRKRDDLLKRREYLALGVAELVLVDRLRNRFTIYEATPQGVSKRILRVGDDWTSERLPDLVFPLATIFSD